MLAKFHMENKLLNKFTSQPNSHHRPCNEIIYYIILHCLRAVIYLMKIKLDRKNLVLYF